MTVVNLVTEQSIEHAILGLLGAKQVLADGLPDGLGEIGDLKMPSGKGSLVDRMRSMLETADTLGPRIVSPEDAAVAALRQRHGEKVLRAEVQTDAAGETRLLAVLDVEAATVSDEARRLGQRPDASAIPIEVVDRAAWLTIQRLMTSGFVTLGGLSRRVLYATQDVAGEIPPSPSWGGTGREASRVGDSR